MKILVIHRDNVPSFLRQNTICGNNNEIEIISFAFSLPDTDIPDFDSFVTDSLSNLELWTYDIILLPLNLSENYLEYTGLRVAAHLRLTPKWDCLTTPLLFLGVDKQDEVARFSELGGILFSYQIFYSSKTNEPDLLKIFGWIQNNSPKGKWKKEDVFNQPEYRSFLLRMKGIQVPANYSSHHSIANEWALLRWIEMFTWNDQKPVIKNKSIENLLYFKYLIMNVAILDGERERFDKKIKKASPRIPKIPNILKDSRILYFDDEGVKGWNSLLSILFRNSGATLIPFPIKKNISKEQLLIEAKDFYNSTQCNCYLIDLRLHEDDFRYDIKPEELSGIKLAEYIHDQNKGNQIVFFTASNKMWNYENAIKQIGNCGYVVKESPEYNYTRKETEKNFAKFGAAIRNALDKSYIAEYVNFLDSHRNLEARHWNLLDQYLDMLLLDEKKNIKYNVINLYVFIDSYIDDRFKLEASKLLLKSDFNKKCTDYNPLLVVFSKDKKDDNGNTDEEKGYKHVRFRDSIRDSFDNRKEETLDITQKSELPIVIVALHYYYGFNTDLCNQVIRLRTERNNHVAHHGGDTYLTTDNLRTIFEKVIMVMLKRDYPN